MGRKVLVAVVCWITLSGSWIDAKKTTFKLEDSVGEASAPRLYRNIPVGVYASASPYAAFSFHVPTFTSSPKFTQIGPIKQESVIVENTHGFLKDSYGNKFVDSPQSVSYKTPFPQQYVQLQELPAHLAQPLVSAAPSFQYKQVTPHFFGPPQFKVQALQSGSPVTNRYAINQPYGYNGAIRNLAPSQQQQHPSSNQAVYAEQFQNVKNLGKSQRLEDHSTNIRIENGPARPATQESAQIKAAATANKGKKAVINIVTKPPVPLLDLSLLEPLTFANPLVPQVQHFLPRINSATYHKLPQPDVNVIKKEMKQFVIQKTKSYDSGVIKDTPKVTKPKKAQPKPKAESEETFNEEAPQPPAGTPEDFSNEEPDITYEINTPNYKETYKEKVVRYNKETQSEPVHYNYEKKTEKEPVHYNYVHTSKEPLQVKNVHYESNSENPKELIYTFKPQENGEHKSENHSELKNESEDSSEKSGKDEISTNQEKQIQDQPHDKESSHSYEKPEHREEANHHNSDKSTQHNIQHNSPQDFSHIINTPIENNDAAFRPIITEYEENIRILPTPEQYAPIKVNPSQHIQPTPVLLNHNSREQHSQQHELPHSYPVNQQRAHYHPDEQPHDKSEPVVNKEDSTEEKPSNEQANDEVPEQEEESEEDFEKGYKDAAFGFPAYESSSRDSEKEIYNPNAYGHSQYHTDYDIERSPFQQYQLEGDEFPKTARLNYKDARDKTKEEYYLDYAVSKPQSIAARYRQKEDYYKMFMKHKPHYLNDERENENKNQKQIAKYIAAPAFEHYSSAQKPKQHFAKYKAAPRPQVFEYDYSKEAPKDNSAHATRPYQRLKTQTLFVEPQFQYGFEPSALPRLLDSELAAMASNDSPESEQPGSRKKIYKEHWYIKKTSSNDKKPAS